jgi:predicted ribosomally synthesized peptide with nif11-like leader
MSLKSAEDFMARFRDDANFRGKLEKAKNDDERREFVKKEGYDFEKEELEKSRGILHKAKDGTDLPRSSGTWAGVAVGAAGAAAAAA